MKLLIFPAMLLALTFIGCSKSGSDDDSNPANPQLSGTKWVVTYFWDKDKDETNDFSGYSFEFKDSGALVAYLPDGSTKTGQWSVSSSSNKLILVIGGTYALDEMADDWVIMTKTNTVMQLKDDNTTHLEELHFKKI
ncbi:MAG: hypothetical protein R3D58_22530 [Saprospiraceae bacterium]|jgi:hypothetical protein|nr:hypothetical protein [Lewinellaceae bacterium]